MASCQCPPIPANTAALGDIMAKQRLPVREASEHVGLSKSTLDKLRVYGGGPVFLKLGKRVVYDVADLDAWLAGKRVANTAQAPR